MLVQSLQTNRATMEAQLANRDDHIRHLEVSTHTSHCDEPLRCAIVVRRRPRAVWVVVVVLQAMVNDLQGRIRDKVVTSHKQQRAAWEAAPSTNLQDDVAPRKGKQDRPVRRLAYRLPYLSTGGPCAPSLEPLGPARGTQGGGRGRRGRRRQPLRLGRQRRHRVPAAVSVSPTTCCFTQR